MAVVIEHGREDIGILVEEEVSCFSVRIDGMLVGETKQSGTWPTCQRSVVSLVYNAADIQCHFLVTECRVYPHHLLSGLGIIRYQHAGLSASPDRVVSSAGRPRSRWRRTVNEVGHLVSRRVAQDALVTVRADTLSLLTNLSNSLSLVDNSLYL